LFASAAFSAYRMQLQTSSSAAAAADDDDDDDD